MAGYNELLEGRYNRALQKLLSMKGKASLESLNPELHAVLNTFYGVENRYLEAWDRFIGGAAVAGAAGNVSGIRFRNPGGSNVVMVLEKMTVSIASTGQVNLTFGAQTADLAVVTTGTTRLDARGRQNTAMSITQQNTTVSIAGTNVFPVNIAGVVNYDLVADENQEVPLLPGDAITWITNTANITLNAAAIWRERSLGESERT